MPQAWESYSNKKDFLNGLKRKAGLEADFWSDDVKIFRFTTETFAESEPRAKAAAKARH